MGVKAKVPCTHAHPIERYFNGRCKKCRREAVREYQARPGMAEKRKAYYKTKDQCPIRKAKHNAGNAKYRAKPDTKALLRSRRGIKNPEIVPALLEAQGNKCAICGTSEWPGNGLHADHDHVTGMMRGMLCNPCNVGVGMFKDDLKRLSAAFEYLLNPPAERLVSP